MRLRHIFLPSPKKLTDTERRLVSLSNQVEVKLNEIWILAELRIIIKPNTPMFPKRISSRFPESKGYKLPVRGLLELSPWFDWL